MIRKYLAIVCLLIAGCQHLPDNLVSGYSHQSTLPGHFQRDHSPAENKALELRGYYPVKRHFF